MASYRHLIKIRTFLKKIDSYLEKYGANSQDVSSFDTLDSNKTTNKFSTNYQLKITFKHPNYCLFTRTMLFQMLKVTICLLQHEIDLFSLIFSVKEFRMENPSYIKLFSHCLYWD